MKIGHYRFYCRFTEKAQLPVYKGSTFRGAFGGALKKTVCAVRDKDCSRCLLSSRCVYARAFEPSPPADGLRQAARPHPYVIRPPASSQTHFAAGDDFIFDLLLCGEFNDSLPFFVYAFETMGEQGLGIGRQRGQGRYILEQIQADGEVIYTHQGQNLGPVQTKDLSLSSPRILTGELTLRLLTPLRLKFSNQFQAELPFHLLVRAMLRRISSLFTAFGGGEPRLDYRGLVARAADVRIQQESLTWHDWKRYSNRQEQSMLMGGLIGDITYHGALGEYLPLLELSQTLHLGKQSAFGLGQIDFEFLPDSTV